MNKSLSIVRLKIITLTHCIFLLIFKLKEPGVCFKYKNAIIMNVNNTLIVHLRILRLRINR